MLPKIQWVLMTKDRKYVAKGANSRDRELVHVGDIDNKKRLITYDSKAIANTMTKRHIRTPHHLYQETSQPGFLEPVKVCVSVKILEDQSE